MSRDFDIEFQLITTGPGGAEYLVFLPNGAEQLYAISDRDCAIMRRSQEDVLEAYVLEDLQRIDPEITDVRLVRR